MAFQQPQANTDFSNKTYWVKWFGDFARAALTNNTPLIINAALSPPQLTASMNNYTPTGIQNCVIMSLTSSTSVNVTGLGSGLTGRFLGLLNTGSNNIVLKNNSGSSLAANRFALTADITLLPGGGILLYYNGSNWYAFRT